MRNLMRNLIDRLKAGFTPAKAIMLILCAGVLIGVVVLIVTQVSYMRENPDAFAAVPAYSGHVRLAASNFLAGIGVV